MENKKYTLVAWTEKGEVHMIPSMVNELSIPYRQRIAELEGRWKDIDDDNEVAWLITRSKAHESLARFFLRVGRPQEAYEEYSNAAIVCATCSDHFWLQGVRAEFPTLPLLYRFLAMHRKALELAKKHPVLKNRYEGGQLEGLYLLFTWDDWESEKEFEEASQIRRAWRFGKCS